MNAKRDRVFKELSKALRQADSKGTSGYDTTADVVRVEGDTVWVHIPGGIDETPVKKTIDAVKGDTVQLRVSGGTAWIVGNETKPPTDDRVANVAKKTAENADLKAILAKKTADDASKVATNYIDFTEEEGLTVGYKDLNSKVNINGDGVKLYDEEGKVGTEIKSGSVIVGREDETHLEIKANGFVLKDYEGNPYASIEDNRDPQTHIGVVTDFFYGDGENPIFYMSCSVADETELKVYVNDTLRTSGYNIVDGEYIAFSNPIPQSGDTVKIVYPSTSELQKTFTFGERELDTTGVYSACFGRSDASGPYSFAQGFAYAEGEGAFAEGDSKSLGECSHSEGRASVAEAFYSHAEGEGTIARGSTLHAEGKYNKHTNSLDIISVVGIGTDNDNRKNGFAVTENGNARIKGDVYVGCNNDSTGGKKVTSQAQGQVLTVSGVTSQSYKDYAVTFRAPYASTPLVVAGLAGTLTAYGMGMVSVAVNNVTTTGFTARVYNASSNDRNVTFRYIAIAP